AEGASAVGRLGRGGANGTWRKRVTEGIHPIREDAQERGIFEAGEDDRISRKTFLKGAAGATGGLGLMPLLAACGGGGSSKDATVYEIKLRPGVTFHNGKTFGADDVIYSIRLMATKTSNALPFVSEINLAELKALDKLTVRVPLKFPDADLAANFVYYNTWI